jgi:hypothetical protein
MESWSRAEDYDREHSRDLRRLLRDPEHPFLLGVYGYSIAGLDKSGQSRKDPRISRFALTYDLLFYEASSDIEHLIVGVLWRLAEDHGLGPWGLDLDWIMANCADVGEVLIQMDGYQSLSNRTSLVKALSAKWGNREISSPDVGPGRAPYVVNHGLGPLNVYVSSSPSDSYELRYAVGGFIPSLPIKEQFFAVSIPPCGPLYVQALPRRSYIEAGRVQYLMSTPSNTRPLPMLLSSTRLAAVGDYIIDIEVPPVQYRRWVWVVGFFSVLILAASVALLRRRSGAKLTGHSKTERRLADINAKIQAGYRHEQYEQSQYEQSQCEHEWERRPNLGDGPPDYWLYCSKCHKSEPWKPGD